VLPYSINCEKMLKIYRDHIEYRDLYKNIGWLIILLYAYYLSASTFLLYIGIIPVLMTVAIFKQIKNQGTILYLNYNRIIIYSEKEIIIEHNNFKKVNFIFDNPLQKGDYDNLKIIKNNNEYSLKIDSYESIRLISFLRECDFSHKINDYRKKNYSSMMKKMREERWVNGIMIFVIAGIILFLLGDYEVFVNSKGSSTKSLIMHFILKIINLLGGKELVITVFVYLLIIVGVDYFYLTDKLNKITPKNS